MDRPRSTEARASLHGKKVLVVEDRYLIARDICRAVRALGGDTVGPVGDLPSAQRTIERMKIDLALVDMNLHDRMATPLIEQLSSRGIPYILATGYEDWVLPPSVRGSVRVEKPIGVRDLQQAIKRVWQ